MDGQLDLLDDVVPSGEWQRGLVRGAGSARPPMKVAGLFAGIGGFELGLSRAGHETRLLCENDSAARTVLNARFPDIVKHDDIRTLDALPPDVDLLAGGFPCQDLSQAGRTEGIGGRNSGLISSVFRLLESRRIPWVLIENVSFMLQLGGGRALSVIVGEFERLGYTWAYRVVDSRAFGLPQRRQRVFLLASVDGDPREVLFSDEAGERPQDARDLNRACGFYWTEGLRGLGWAYDAVPTLKGGSGIGIPSPPAILMPSLEVVTPGIRDAERLQGFPVDWTRPAEAGAKRSARWKLVGNAVTVDVAHWIGHRLRYPLPYHHRRERPIKPSGRWPSAAWGRKGARSAVDLSAFPAACKPRSLGDFLRFPTSVLSAKAARGFLSRARRAKLRFPDGFLDAIQVHVDRMTELDRHCWEERAPWVDGRSADLGEAGAHQAKEDGAGDGGSNSAPPPRSPLPGEQPGFAW